MGTTSVTAAEIGYIAGILDGEGYFGYKRGIKIRVGMSDFDIIYRIRNMMDESVDISTIVSKKKECKDMYYFSVYGHVAAGWMMTVYSLMGRRRKEQIRKCINIWTSCVKKSIIDGECPAGHKLLVFGKDYTINYRTGGKICMFCRRNQATIYNARRAARVRLARNELVN